MNARALIAMVLALVFPGAGHLFLGRRALAGAFAAIVVILFATGLAAGGDLYSLPESRGDVLKTLASIGSMGGGGLYLLGLLTRPWGSLTDRTFEYGTTFTLTAGLMNLLLVLDCYDRAREQTTP